MPAIVDTPQEPSKLRTTLLAPVRWLAKGLLIALSIIFIIFCIIFLLAALVLGGLYYVAGGKIAIELIIQRGIEEIDARAQAIINTPQTTHDTDTNKEIDANVQALIVKYGKPDVGDEFIKEIENFINGLECIGKNVEKDPKKYQLTEDEVQYALKCLQRIQTTTTKRSTNKLTLKQILNLVWKACNDESTKPNVSTNDEGKKSAEPNVSTNDEDKKSAEPNVSTNDESKESAEPNVSTNDEGKKSAEPNVSTNDEDKKSAKPNIDINERIIERKYNLVIHLIESETEYLDQYEACFGGTFNAIVTSLYRFKEFTFLKKECKLDMKLKFENDLKKKGEELFNQLSNKEKNQVAAALSNPSTNFFLNYIESFKNHPACAVLGEEKCYRLVREHFENLQYNNEVAQFTR